MKQSLLRSNVHEEPEAECDVSSFTLFQPSDRTYRMLLDFIPNPNSRALLRFQINTILSDVDARMCPAERQGVRLHCDPTSSDILQQSGRARPMAPRFWVTIYLPACARTLGPPPAHPLPLITVLDLPQCPQIEGQKSMWSLGLLH